MSELRRVVSVCGSPMQRLGVYMLEGLVARLASLGSSIYKALKCKELTSVELFSTCTCFMKSVHTSDVEIKDLNVRPGEPLAVNFALVLHHMHDESAGTQNHRDRLLRMVKSLSPKIVTLVEQESNTNTVQFFPYFLETLNYYLSVFESIDVALPRDHKE
ncbi:Scarecrow-like protein 21 [Capsicum annuum]|uniref:Scarecrow-like protein 21 n=1 Tax=Capsicum annuum TaxID=4072 RepID=A0A2G3ALV2_CAPAN|nr:Scarecrow-like protein 21 [Capsicum annuum]